MKKTLSTFLAILIVLSVMPLSMFSVSAATNVVPSGAKQFNGHTYYVFKSKVSWSKAKAYCESKGGHLATITSAKENNFIYNLMQKLKVDDVYIGGTKDSNGSWKWITGEKFKYTNWDYGEPSSYSDRNYLEMYKGNEWGAWTDKWDGTMYSNLGYVCEWDMTKTKASGVRLAKTSETVYYKATTTLKVLNTTKKASWTTSNKKVATVTSKGKVTGVGVGTCTITAKVGTKKLKCKITVKDRNVTATSTFKVNGGGYFLKGVSDAKVTFKLKSYNAAKAYVYIKNSAGTTVYSKTFTKLTKNKNYSFNWYGKKNSGSYVPAGSYRVVVKVGSKNSYSSYLAFKTTNDFSGGNGSKAKPFLVATTSQFRKIIKYPYAYFKQTKNLDFDYTDISGLFTTVKPFTGVYDGNGKTISNITAKDALFNVLGKNGTIKNLNLKNCSVLGTINTAIFVKTNYGKITDCSINGAIAVTTNECVNLGFMVYENYGTLTNCVTNGQVSSSVSTSCGGSSSFTGHRWAYASGMVAFNQPEGKIISCISNVNVISQPCHNNYTCGAGGIAIDNNGLINDCEATGTVTAKISGGVASKNKGQIMNSFYTGSSSVNLAGENTGVIL